MLEHERLTAEKCRISDIVTGKYVSKDGFEPNYVLSRDGRKLSRVHVLATVINRYISDDSKYGFIVLDDGEAMIRLKAFQDTGIIKALRKGDIVDVFGRIRQYNNEMHIFPEIVKKVDDPNFETLRKAELVYLMNEQRSKRETILAEVKRHRDVSEIESGLSSRDIRAEDVKAALGAENVIEEENDKESAEVDMKAAKGLIIKSIEELDSGDGVECTRIIEKVGLPERVAESAIDELLSEGSCYEPRAGRIKAL